MRIEKLCAGYHKKIIIRDLDIDITKGEIISLIGPNGGGKSTLIKTITGELDPLGGAVYIGKDDIKEISLKDLSRKMSIVNTDRIKPQLMSAMDVVLSGRLPYSNGFGVFSESDHIAAKSACDMMQITALADIPFENLSDGQKQRTIIARAICQKPQFLVMDEPTSYLDIRYRMELMDVFRQLSADGVTIIMSLHELELALNISGRVLMVSNNGSVICKDSAEVIKSGLLLELYELSDEMYNRIRAQLEAADSTAEADTQEHCRHSAYFLNKACEYYPCHKLSEEKFSCMFCYCPLFDMPDCGGTYTITESGIKNCRDCVFPHERDNYSLVIKRLKGKIYGTDADQ